MEKAVKISIVIAILAVVLILITGCGAKKDKTDNENKNVSSQNYKNIEWKLDTPIYFADWTHAVVNAVSGVKTPMNLQFTANGTFSFEIINKDIYEKNNNQESIKEFVAGKCANFLNEITSKETFNSDKNLKEQINESDLLEYINRYTEDVGIRVTDITLDKFELTDDSIAKIKEYNKKMNK